MRAWVALLAMVTIFNFSCGRPAEPPDEETVATVAWQPLASYEMTETQKAQHELALAAVNAMMSELIGELEAALDSGGPAAGIAVCQSQAPMIARRVSDQFGVSVGRTSFALRNPSNLPPAWAETLVTEHVNEPIFVAGPAGELGALLPIRLKAECQTCHGPAEAISEEVRAAIAQHYPEDRATGFEEGNLRGWYWIEVPGGAGSNEETGM